MTLSEPKATPEGRYIHLVVLNAAASRPDKLVTRHKRLPGAALQNVCAALVKRGLLAELTGVSRDPDVLHVKTELGMTEYAITPAGLAAITACSCDPDVLHVKTELGLTEYGITPAGLRAIGVEPEEEEEPIPPYDSEEERAMQLAIIGEREIAAAEAAEAAEAEARPAATTAPTGAPDAAGAPPPRGG
jgi:hypothetical protein